MKLSKSLFLSICAVASLSSSQKQEVRVIAEQIMDQAVQELFNGISKKDVNLIENALKIGISANHDYTYRLTLTDGVYKEIKRTPLTYALSFPDNLAVVKILTQYGAHIDKPDGDKNLPLNSAIFSNNTAVVEYFIAQGANLQAKDGKNKAPIHQAIQSNLLNIVSQLLQAGANPNQKGGIYNISPLIMAIDQNNKDMVTLLLNHGGDCSGAYDYAIKYGSLEIAAILRKHANKKGSKEALEKKPLE
jgi:ankyrin repeat protein